MAMRMPGQFVPSPNAPWRLQSVANRPGGIRAAKGTPPNSSARHVQDTAEKEQRAKPYQEHSVPLNLRLLVDHWLKLAIVDAKGTIRAQAKPCVCRKSDSAILMVKAAKDRSRDDGAEAPNRAMGWGVLVTR